MTEAEWLAASDPMPMLEFLRGKASDRKLRLFAVSCCYLSVRNDTHGEDIEMFESVVQYADGATSLDKMRDYWTRGYNRSAPGFPALGTTFPEQPVRWVSEFVSVATLPLEEKAEELEDWPVSRELVSLFRDIFGNPFRIYFLQPSWLTSNVLTLATGIYFEKAFDRLPYLADALQDAGCENEDILNHCRQPGEHVRGCWVCDLLLSKK